MTVGGTARRAIGVLALLLVAACGSPPQLVGVDNPARPTLSVETATRHRIFITTTRSPAEEPGVFFSGDRAAELALAAVTVSVPPDHVAGAIERPKRLPPDPAREFAVVDPVVYAADRDFVAAINAELARRKPEDREVLLFVHGYNNTMSDSILRIAQFVEDTGFTGIPVLFSWASAGRTRDYVYDINSALAARPLLEEASGILTQTRAAGFDVFAHSMGTLLVTEVMVQSDIAGTLGSSGKLHNIMFAAPDIDLDVFHSQLSQIRNRPGNLYIFVSRDDRALSVSRRVSGGVTRVGAASAAELADLGVTVIDLSAIHDSSSGSHSKFAGSPEVVQLIGGSLQRNNFDSAPRPPTVVEVLQGVPVLNEFIP